MEADYFMIENEIWMKYEKNKVIKSNFYLRIYDSINKSNREHVVIKEYNKHYIDIKKFESIEKFYKLINSITLLETIVKKYLYSSRKRCFLFRKLFKTKKSRFFSL